MNLNEKNHGEFVKRLNPYKGSTGVFLFRFKVLSKTAGNFIKLHFVHKRIL